jgi:hypothetical protein
MYCLDRVPAQGLPATKVGAFTQALYDQAQKQGWTVISMKNDWKKIFSFEQRAPLSRGWKHRITPPAR